VRAREDAEKKKEEKTEDYCAANMDGRLERGIVDIPSSSSSSRGSVLQKRDRVRERERERTSTDATGSALLFALLGLGVPRAKLHAEICIARSLALANGGGRVRE